MKKLEDPQQKLICVIDDEEGVNSVICHFLTSQGYQVNSFSSGVEFKTYFEKSAHQIDLIVTDVHMPGMTGYELCRMVRNASGDERIPLVMVTGSDPATEKRVGIEAGADDFFEKPFQPPVLLAKIRSLLQIRDGDIERVGKFKRFISPNVARLVGSSHAQLALKPHQSQVTVLCIDLRGFTAFSETANPSAVLELLNQYYLLVGRAAIAHGATLSQLSGDGIMVFLNDPTPIDDHQEVGVRLALEIQAGLFEQRAQWSAKGYKIDFGIGLAEGMASIGGIGFEQFQQYTVIGPVPNLASRICSLAVNGQILVSSRYLASLNCSGCQTQPQGSHLLKGIETAVSLHSITSLPTKTKSAV